MADEAAATSPASRPRERIGGHRGRRGRPWPHGRGVRQGRGGSRSCADVRGARRLRGDVVRALLVQELARLAAPAADDGPAGDPGSRRERGCRRHRRGARRRLQDREPQSPVVHRAFPGGSHRRWWHPARRVHDGRPARRESRCPALRPPGPSADAVPREGRRRRHRPLRQLHRRAHRRRRPLLRRRLRSQHPRERVHVRRGAS